MKNLIYAIRNLFPSKPTAARRPSSVKLGFDALEERMALSASSLSIHSVLDASGNSAAFWNNPTPAPGTVVYNEGFHFKTPQGVDNVIAPVGAVTDFSAGLDRSGNADVFAHYYGVMEEFTQSTGWVNLNQPEQMVAFAAVNNGNLYAVGKDHALWQYYSPETISVGGRSIIKLGGWKELLGPNTFIAVDAVTSHGQDIVVGMNANRQLSWFDPATGYLDSFSGSVNSYSVGLDTSGYFDVFVVTGNPNGSTGQLQKYDAAQGGWQTINTFGFITPLATISATSNGECFALVNLPIANGGSVTQIFEYQSSNGSFDPLRLPPGAPVDAISAAGADHIFAQENNVFGTAEEYSPSFYNDWKTWN
jgi:hypothetical protein